MSKHIRGLRRRVPVTATVLVALALAAVPAVFASAAQAQTTLKGTLTPIGSITQQKSGPPTSGSYTASYFQLENGTTTNISKDSPAGTFDENSSITAYDAYYTPLYAGSTGLKLASFQSDPSPFGEILNDGLNQQPFDGAEFDTYTTEYADPPNDTEDDYTVPALSYVSSGSHPWYELDGVTGYLVTGDLSSWTVNWYADPTLYYNQGADSNDTSVGAGGSSSSDPTALDGLAGESGADANANLVGVYDTSNKKIALEWTSLIDNTTQDSGDAPFDSSYGVWNLVGGGLTH